jgi:hypothetical protein
MKPDIISIQFRDELNTRYNLTCEVENFEYTSENRIIKITIDYESLRHLFDQKTIEEGL